MVMFISIYTLIGVVMFILLARARRDKHGNIWSPAMIFWASVFWWFAAFCMLVGWLSDLDYSFVSAPVEWTITEIRKW